MEMSIDNRTYGMFTAPPPPPPAGDEQRTVIKVFLVNGESRSLQLDSRTEASDIVHFILHRLRVNMDVAPRMFGILLRHRHSPEAYWLHSGFSVKELMAEYCGGRPLEEWQFLLRLRILPKTPQHLKSQDSPTFKYYYDQVHRMFLDSDSVVVDNDTSVKLGCLELRRFYKDMPQIALKKRENFTVLERDIGLEKFFKRSLLNSVKRKALRSMVLAAFQQYERLTMEECVFHFFNLLSKHHPLDEESFTSCAIGDDQTTPLTYEIFVGPNCQLEYKPENGERRFLAAFNDIQDISYEVELMSRGRVYLIKSNGPAVVIRTAQLVQAIHLSTLIDGYCMVYTATPHSRMSGNIARNRYSSSSGRYSGLYNSIDEVRHTLPQPYMTFRNSSAEFAESEVYATVQEESSLLGRPIDFSEVELGEKIGEGQFGDVHRGVLYPASNEESAVAIKTCKPDASQEDRAKFLEEAAVMRKFNHPHIIKLFGVMSHDSVTFIVMELAPHGQLRRYLLLEGALISRVMLLEYLRQLASAMVHLEERNYVHRDIAARNILVSSPVVVKLADFGLSRGLDDATDYYVASRGKLPIKWMAPESINFRRFTGLSDVWMFGVCCWEVLMRGVKPFVGIKNDEVISKIEIGERLALPPECPASLFRLMNLCWQYDPEDRPRFVDIEQNINDIVEEERQLDMLTQRRRLEGIQPDPEAPVKPYRGPALSHTPSDLKRLSAMSHDLDTKRYSDIEDNHRLVGHTHPSVMPDRRPSPPSSSPPLKPPRMSVQPPPEDTPLEAPPPLPIEPYFITTISAAASGRSSHGGGGEGRRSQSPVPSHIPPPSILLSQQQQRPASGSSDTYYSTPAELQLLAERGPSSSRVLTEEGVFVDRTTSSGRPVSHGSTEDSSGLASPEPSFQPKDDDVILVHTTAVVKSVMQFSNKVPLSRPTDYVDLVKNVGVALRTLLGKVDELMKELPPQTHEEVSMAHKVLSSDMGNLVTAMKSAQKHYQTFLEGEYQKEMLKAAHIIAVNSKQLLDAANSARRKAQLVSR